MVRRWVLACTALFAALSLFGCGGHGAGAGAGAGGATPLLLDIIWPARTRQVTAPASALSVRVSLPGALSGGGNLLWSIDRDAELGVHTVHYISPQAVVPGDYRLTMTFFAEAGAASTLDNPIVGTVNANVTVFQDGGGVPTVEAQATIVAVTVLPSQSTVVDGGAAQLFAIGQDFHGNLVAVEPGAIAWASLRQDLLTVTPDGLATFVSPGMAQVVATIDKVTSAPGDVRAASLVTVAVDQAPSVAVATNGTQQFTATVANDPFSLGVSWTVQEQGGGTISPTGLYTAPASPGTFTVVASSIYDPLVSNTCAVVVS
ncbi:MAG: hypothetical protein HYR64_03830 [Fimbriimonas ginsengisoli]|uniref:BIG2 domain-containing protein n=1 Tax=Fimbriimonas ginsengisoli TaxID=1005039 RepID=A0A931LU51_FIMGI|nr:hypothetical protein [Fimbriimonas ginsengisoli]